MRADVTYLRFVTTPGARIEEALGRLLLRSTRARLYDRLIEGVEGVDVTTYPVLSGVARLGPVSASRLGAEIGLDRTATTRYATRLADAGLLHRMPDPNDARATLLALTEAGEAAVGLMRQNLVREFDRTLRDWTTEAAERFAGELERFADQVREDD